MSENDSMTGELASQLILASVNKDMASVESGADLNDLRNPMARIEEFRAMNNVGMTLTLMVGADRKTGEMAAHFEVGGVAASMLLAGHLMPVVVSDHINRMTKSCGCEDCAQYALTRALKHMTGMSSEKANG